MRYLNYWDNKNFLGAKSGPLTHASSVKYILTCKMIRHKYSSDNQSNQNTSLMKGHSFLCFCIKFQCYWIEFSVNLILIYYLVNFGKIDSWISTHITAKNYFTRVQFWYTDVILKSNMTTSLLFHYTNFIFLHTWEKSG